MPIFTVLRRIKVKVPAYVTTYLAISCKLNNFAAQYLVGSMQFFLPFRLAYRGGNPGGQTFLSGHNKDGHSCPSLLHPAAYRRLVGLFSPIFINFFNSFSISDVWMFRLTTRPWESTRIIVGTVRMPS
jgi:hypothetical protein